MSSFLQNMGQILRHNPDQRMIALRMITGRAKAELQDVPPHTWQNDLNARAVYDKSGTPYPPWNLDLQRGPEGVNGLIGFLKTCDHWKARRWYAAAYQLFWCMSAMRDPANASPATIDNIIHWIGEPDRQAGRTSREGQSDKAKKPRFNRKAQAIIDSLAQRRDETAKELWPEFFSALEMADMDPIERTDDPDPNKWTIEYINAETGKPERPISFKTFQNKLAAARRRWRTER